MMKLLRTVVTTAAALATGAWTMATGSGETHPIELQPGDRAPAFDLPGSDGKRYRLADFAGREAVVIAWFPKAFTGG